MRCDRVGSVCADMRAAFDTAFSTPLTQHCCAVFRMLVRATLKSTAHVSR